MELSTTLMVEPTQHCARMASEAVMVHGVSKASIKGELGGTGAYTGAKETGG